MQREDQLHSMMENIEKLITCPNCRIRYNNPKLLPCGHSFCCKCLKEVLIPDGKNCRSCPISSCRRKFCLPHENDVENLPKNTVIDNLIQICQKTEQENEHCSLHRQQRSVTLCIDCNKLMCVDCTEMHKSIMVPHTILPIDKTKHASIKKVLDSSDRSQLCQTHHDKLVTSYCKTCNVTYCAKCEQHASHDTKTIPAAAWYVRKHLQQYIADQSQVETQIRDRISDYSRFQTELVSQLESSRETLYKFSGFLQDCIRQKAQAVDEVLTQRFTDQKRDSSIIIKQLEGKEAVGKSFINDILASLNYGSNVQLVRSTSGFDKRYSDIVTLPLHLLNPAMKPMFQFKPSSDTKPIKEFVIGSICEHQPVTQGQTKVRSQASRDERYYERHNTQ